jgi:ribosome biogenesis GTPase
MHPVNLNEIGWTPERDRDFEPFSTEGFFPGRVTVSYGSSVIAWTANGELRPAVAGRLKLESETEAEKGHPVVGDWVAIRPAIGTSSPLVHAILPRRTAFVRKVAGLRTRPQVVAANIDRVFIVTSANREFSTARLERYLTLTRESGAEPIVILGKKDVAGEFLPDFIADAQQVALGVPVFAVSALTGDGFENLLPYIGPGNTIALLGSSGVGKSTIINRLLGTENIRTQEIRNDDRGRHTTTQREMLRLPNGGLVIDTPGMRELQLWEGSEGIHEAFDEIEKLAENCRFRDCKHISEPDCAVLAAVEAGQLDEQRLASYQQLSTEIAAAGERKTELGRSERKRNERIASRSQKPFKNR